MPTNTLLSHTWLEKIGARFRPSDFARDLSCVASDVIANRASYSTLSDKELIDQFSDIAGACALSEEGFDLNQAGLLACLVDQAVIREMGFFPHDVQIRGALATAAGNIIEMQTGEGKTIVTAMAAAIRSAFDPSVHVATTTDYLAERDHDTVAPLFNRLGIPSTVLSKKDQPAETKLAYQCRIVYGPGYLFGFDYLHDQMVIRKAAETTLGRTVLEKISGTDLKSQLAQTDHACILVDEADSVLIDEATTPLILSAPSLAAECTPVQRRSFEFARLVGDELREGEDYQVDRVEQTIEIGESGRGHSFRRFNENGRLELERPWDDYVRNALYAKHLLIRDEHYVVIDDALALVDQMTGRIFDDRTLRGGLHQAVEAKEGISITPPNSSVARVTRQRFFQLYDCVGGMTGTATGSEDELNHFYGTDVVPFEPHLPNKRIELPTRFFLNFDQKLGAIIREVSEFRKTGRPLLIGTRTIRESHQVFEALTREEIQCTLLNGIQDADEANIIARAGEKGAIVIATNMAGRGTDIKLTPESRRLGGLHVLATSCNRSARVDRQLAGRSARQGDPGSCQFFVAADDDIFLRFGQRLSHEIIRAASAAGECDAADATVFASRLYQLQRLIERHEYETRRKLVRHDRWMDSIREAMVAQ